jgi:Uma2 family endonuclease
MSAQPQRKPTSAEYLVFERQSEEKHEYQGGEIIAMSGASRAHGRISWNLSGTLFPQLESRGCEAFVSDMRVHIPVTDRYTYPDLVVACGDPRFEDAELDTLTTPTLIIEILSPTTEDRDRGTKLFQYRSIPSLEVILLVAQDRVHVEQYLRQGDGSWILTDFDDLETVLELPAIGSRLTLADIYKRVPGL